MLKYFMSRALSWIVMKKNYFEVRLLTSDRFACGANSHYYIVNCLGA